jgi:hypothetical protein
VLKRPEEDVAEETAEKKDQIEKYEEVQKRYQKELSLYHKQIKRQEKERDGGRAA